MMNHLKNYILIYILGALVLVFSIMFPDFELVISGGFAWFSIFISWTLGLILIGISLFGGSVSYESIGLIGWIKEFKQRGKEDE